MNCNRVWAAAPFLALLACSSSSGSAGSPDETQGNDGAASQQADGGADVSMSMTMPDGDGGAAAAEGGGSSPEGSTAGGSGSAGKAGVDSFCTQIAAHEEHCAAVLDASAAGLSGFAASCESMNEAAGSSPPTEFYRADYLAALGSCIAGSSCSVALATVESQCGMSVTVSPTQAVTAFCTAFTGSPCGPDAGGASCVPAYTIYSDAVLSAATACFSTTSCTQVDTCYSTALSQP